MNALHGISVYNQDRLGDESFVANFVARINELEQILDELRAIAHGSDIRHSVIVGARGMGKSTMLRRVSIAVRRDAELDACFMALSFREEQYNVISLDAFWRNCGEALAEWCEQTGRNDLANELDRVIESADWYDAEKAEAAFRDYCRRIGRRPLLLLDNLDIILDGLKDQENWKLRAALQAKDGPVVLGGATKLLEQGGDRDAPFYEFFYPHFLEPLSEAELLSCMYTLAEARAEAGAHVTQILAREPERAKTLYALTGGNPRVLALIYQVLERTETDHIFADLEALLDQVTPYYKARIEEYQAPQQRAVIDAVALNWDPIGSRALAKATGIEITTISSQLNRLRKDGIVEEVKSSGARASYQLSERFLNIWYLMRHGTRRTRQRLRWLTLFLARLFSIDELRSMAEEARAEASCRWNVGYREAVLAAHDLVNMTAKAGAAQPGLNGPLAAGAEKLQEQDGVRVENENLKNAGALAQGGDFEGALALLESSMATLSDSSAPEDQYIMIEAMIFKSFLLSNIGRDEDAIVVDEDIFEKFKSCDADDIQHTLSISMVNRALKLAILGRRPEAISAYDEIIARYDATHISDLQAILAMALLSKGITLNDAGEPEDALSVYDQLFARYQGMDADEVQISVARSLLNKGVVLGSLGRSTEELSVYDELIGRYKESDVPQLQEQVAKAILNKGKTLGQLGQVEAELAAYDAVISLYDTSDRPELLEQVVNALLSKASVVGTLGRDDEVVAITGDIIRHHGEMETPEMQGLLAMTLLLRAIAFGQLGSSEKEIGAYDEVFARFGGAQDALTRRRVATALLNKGMTLENLDRKREAADVYDQIIDLYDAVDDPDLQVSVARAQLFKAMYLGERGESLDALAINDTLLSRYQPADAFPAMRDVLASALFDKAHHYGKLGRFDDELATYDELIVRYGDIESPEIEGKVASAFVLKGILLWQMGRSKDALAAYEEIETRYAGNDAPAIQERAAAALTFKGFAYGHLGQAAEEIEAYDEVARRYGEAESGRVQQHVAEALLSKGKALIQLGEIDRAATLYDDVVARYRNSSAPELKDKVGNAFGNKGNHLLDRCGDAPGAEIAYRNGLEYAPLDIFLKANLAWALLVQGKFEELAQLRDNLDGIEEVGTLLLDAATEIAKGNLGQATAYLGDVLDRGLEAEGSAFFEDLLRLVRIAVKRGAGEVLIGWFADTGNHDRYAPVYAALVAFERGERFLNDFNPEVGKSARQFLAFLSAPERHGT